MVRKQSKVNLTKSLMSEQRPLEDGYLHCSPQWVFRTPIALEAEGYFVPIQHFPELRTKIPRGC